MRRAPWNPHGTTGAVFVIGSYNEQTAVDAVARRPGSGGMNFRGIMKAELRAGALLGHPEQPNDPRLPGARQRRCSWKTSDSKLQGFGVRVRPHQCDVLRRGPQGGFWAWPGGAFL